MSALAIHAIGGSELPGDGRLPSSVMWIPPGHHRITASTRDGKPVAVSVTVNASTAATVQAAFARMSAAADAGVGDRPFFDFNHDDQEASAHPSEFYWAGTDAKTGGVRARLTWTDLGARAVVGRSYRRFSPVFFSKDGVVTGIPVNCGGVVNIAAFSTIAPIIAKAADVIAARAIGEMVRAVGSEEDFVIAARHVAAQRGLEESEALETLAKENPAAYHAYRMDLGLGRHHEVFAGASSSPAATTAEGLLLAELAEAITAKQGGEVEDAMLALVVARPALYDAYRAGLNLGGRQFQAVQSERVHPFAERVRSLAERSGISQREAYAVTARQDPQAWESFRAQTAQPPALVATSAIGATLVRAAQELSTKQGVDQEDALISILAANPKSYRAYMASLGLGGRKLEEEQAALPVHPFIQKVRRLAAAGNLSERQAFKQIADEEPELFESYREQIAEPDPADAG